jgi:hypothetical protein
MSFGKVARLYSRTAKYLAIAFSICAAILPSSFDRRWSSRTSYAPAKILNRSRAIGACPARNTWEEDAATFAKGLGNDWRLGERRAIHRRHYVRRKPVPRRPSMLDARITQIEAWLATEPHRTEPNRG